MKYFIACVIIAVGLITPVSCTVKDIQFNQNCAGYLKQTADANTAEIALQRITLALDYIERNHLTDGYTSVLWNTEDENVGFWYENIKVCKAELKACLNSSQLEQTNVLMKVRESLMDGKELTIPNGISRYPNNAVWMIFGWLVEFPAHCWRHYLDFVFMWRRVVLLVTSKPITALSRILQAGNTRPSKY